MRNFIGHIKPVYSDGLETGVRLVCVDRAHRKQIIESLIERGMSYQIYISEQEMIRIEKKLLTPHYRRRTLSFLYEEN